MRVVPFLLGPLVAVVLLAGCRSEADAGGEIQDESAVRQELADWWVAWAQALTDEDIDAMRALLTEDLRVMEPGMDLSSGAEFLTFAEEVLSGADVTAFEARARELFVHGDAAYQIGEYDEAVASPEGSMEFRSFFFTRWERGEDGRWRLDRIVAGPREAPEAM